MNILVTGGCGLIGSNLVSKLRSLGHNVITVDLKENADYILDISTEDLLRIKDDIDIIFHLAAQPYGRGSEINPVQDLDYNIKGTMNVCYLAKQKRVSKLIYTSTMAVYGNNKFASESSDLNPLSNYAVSKLAAEYYIKKFSNEAEFNYTIYRLWNTYGPGQDLSNQYKGIVNAFATQILKSKDIEVTGSLDRFRDIIYVDDVVDALIRSMEFTESDIYNVSTGTGITIRELINSIIIASDADPNEFTIRDIGGHAGDQHGCIGNNYKLKTHCGWIPKTSLQEGLIKFIKYIKENI